MSTVKAGDTCALEICVRHLRKRAAMITVCVADGNVELALSDVFLSDIAKPFEEISISGCEPGYSGI